MKINHIFKSRNPYLGSFCYTSLSNTGIKKSAYGLDEFRKSRGTRVYGCLNTERELIEWNSVYVGTIEGNITESKLKDLFPEEFL